MRARRAVARMPIVQPVTAPLIASPRAVRAVPAAATGAPCEPTSVDVPRLPSEHGDEALGLGAVRRAVEAVDERQFALADETGQ